MNNKKKDDVRLRSWIFLFAGLTGLFWQQWTGEVHWILSIIFTIMTGVPGATSIISLLKKSPTILQSSVSPQLPSEQESSNVSTTSEDEV